MSDPDEDPLRRIMERSDQDALRMLYDASVTFCKTTPRNENYPEAYHQFKLAMWQVEYNLREMVIPDSDPIEFDAYRSPGHVIKHWENGQLMDQVKLNPVETSDEVRSDGDGEESW